MEDILTNHLWQFIGSILALLAIITTVVIFLIQRKRKRLSYEILSKSPLISKKEELEGKLEIKYLGQEVTDVYLVLLEFSNSGNVPIQSADYEKKINVKFGNTSAILSAEIEGVNPVNLDIETSYIDDQVFIEPVLLNPKDSFKLRILTNNFDNNISVNGRIIGVKEIREGRYGQVEFFTVSIIGLILTGFGLFTVGSLESNADPNQEMVGMISLVIGYLTMFFALVRRKSFHEVIKLLRKGIIRI